MEILIAIAGLAGLVWVVHQLSKVRRPSSPPRQHSASEREARERQRRMLAQRQAAQRVSQSYRELQRGLQQLRRAPDFRRAAAAAQRAAQVPLRYRQQQFRRFRPLLVAFLADKLQQGSNTRQTAAGLQELVTALGLASFEAEYIITDAQVRTAARRAAPPSFAEQARQWQQEHQDRLQTIRALPDLDPEVREQLLELEHERFRDQLLRSGGSDEEIPHQPSLQE